MHSLDADGREVLSRCIEAVETSEDAQRDLLRLGLQATEAGRPDSDVGAGAGGPGGGNREGGGSDQQWWRWQRLLVLQHLERLDTVLALYKG